MPITSSITKDTIDFNIDQLEEIAKEIRSLAITAITAAGSGHTGGVMSIIDIATVLYLKIANHDPSNPDWADRDRIFWSAGHKAPALYAVLGISGYFDKDHVVKLRKLDSGFEGHPNRFSLKGIEFSSGSLGHGLGVAIGSALNAKLKAKGYRVYCILGDGELNEGSVWEAAMSASHYKLNNLIAIIDRNKLQIDGNTSKVMEIEPLVDKFNSFGFKVMEVDGHNIADLIEVFTKAHSVKNKPVAIIANTTKGKCISFAENICSYHGISPKDGIHGAESLETALSDIGCNSYGSEKVNNLLKIASEYQTEIDKEVATITPKFSKDYWWNTQKNMKVDLEPTRVGFGGAIKELGNDPRVVALGADITGSIKMSDFYSNNPERVSRFFTMGIAEQNMTAVAAGMAKEGLIPFIGSYGVFITGRNWDQIRTTVCYNNYNVKIACAHAGISVGPDGATHQSLEDISNIYYLPNMKLVVPADSIETKKLTRLICYLEGPATIRYAREATPIISTEDTPCKFGEANIIRYRGLKRKFIEAFSTVLSTDYKSEGEDLSIIACGPMVAEAMRAAYILKEEYNIEARIVNIHTLKPIDRDAIIAAAVSTKAIITCEEHQLGGFGNVVAGVITTATINKPIYMDMIGIKDRFGKSGQPWELMKVFRLVAENIVEKAKTLLQQYKKEQF